MRKVVFQNNEFYHIYNRGVDRREVFGNEGDFGRFLEGLRWFGRGLEPVELTDCPKMTSYPHQI